jgi:hypothetical protein
MRMSAAEEVNSLVVSSLTAAEGRGTSGSMPVQVREHVVAGSPCMPCNRCGLVGNAS